MNPMVRVKVPLRSSTSASRGIRRRGREEGRKKEGRRKKKAARKGPRARTEDAEEKGGRREQGEGGGRRQTFLLGSLEGRSGRSGSLLDAPGRVPESPSVLGSHQRTPLGRFSSACFRGWTSTNRVVVNLEDGEGGQRNLKIKSGQRKSKFQNGVGPPRLKYKKLNSELMLLLPLLRKTVFSGT
jgi:hypothetical protein